MGDQEHVGIIHQRQVQQNVHHKQEHVMMDQYHEVTDIRVVVSIIDHVLYVGQR